MSKPTETNAWAKADEAKKEWAAAAKQRINDGLRDSFATAALTGLLAGRTSTPEYPNIVAAQAYEFADAMMKARHRWLKG